MASFCTNCGTELKDSVKFCSRCGAAVSDTVVPVAAPGELDRRDGSFQTSIASSGNTPTLSTRPSARWILIGGLSILLAFSVSYWTMVSRRSVSPPVFPSVDDSTAPTTAAAKVATDQTQRPTEAKPTDVRTSGPQVSSVNDNTKKTVSSTSRLGSFATSKVFRGHESEVQSVAVSPDSRFVLSGGSYKDGTVRLWDVGTGEEVRRFLGHGTETDVLAVAFSPDMTTVVSGGSVHDFTIRVWDIKSGHEIRRVVGDLSCGIFRAFSADGRRALGLSLGGSSVGGGFCLWDVDRGRQVREFSARGAGKLALSSDATRALVTLDHADGGVIQMWDLTSGRILQTFRGHDKGAVVMSAAIDPTGDRILSSASDLTVRLWDAATGKEIRRLEGHTGSVRCLTFSQDGRLVVTGGEDKTVRIWNLTTGREIDRHEGHMDAISAVAFSPDGRFAVSGGVDRTVRLWDLVKSEH